MAEYHVGCGLAGIYAGVFKKNKNDEWLHKSNVTDEALIAVATYLHSKIDKGQNSFGYVYKMINGKHITLSVKVTDEEPKKKINEDNAQK